jgi:hypothetical protein
MIDKQPLAVEYARIGPYYVIRLLDDDPGSRGDLSELIELVGKSILEGNKTIAVSFTRSALLFTRSISALVRCYAMLDDAGGSFAVVAPNPHLMHAIQVSGIDTIIKTVGSEDALPGSNG